MRRILPLLSLLAAAGGWMGTGDPGSLRVTYRGDTSGVFSVRGPALPAAPNHETVVYAVSTFPGAIVVARTPNGVLSIGVPTEPGEYACTAVDKCEFSVRFVAPVPAGTPFDPGVDGWQTGAPHGGRVTILPGPKGRVRGTFTGKVYSETTERIVRSIDLTSGAFDAEIVELPEP